ncbi:FAD-binding oxidoreductase [Magnetospira sp. QH-2]|uniref:FAD-binding oxidoreductase n=1 Tax=Magnetospira sp. (strain QH-2) TaxID=1288970 RepID=UPI0003E8127F|nr:FAD-binding oxidoreductase [Magnetospira sp. QH-2]CCQ73994.1 Putative D-lactate ferricytochrome C oxidoreductase [Magnetospira sp. QH-2]
MTDKLIAALSDILGPKGVVAPGPDMEGYLEESRDLYRGEALAVAKPATTDETAAVVRLCAQSGLPIFPQGGNTGLVGGAVAEGGVILSTERLNRIREIDPLNMTMTVEAGVILQNVQVAADEADCLFPLSLAAEGTCRIGGNIATNAGGTAVLRYGNTRELVLGLEVVTAEGEVWNGLRGLRKDNTGYDMKQLFIGSEGTLGIITAAVIKLFPKPSARATALAACPDLDSLMKLFNVARIRAGDSLTAFEMMARFSVEVVTRHMEGLRDPFDDAHDWYALVELTSSRPDDSLEELLETVLGEAFESEWVTDAVIASSLTQAEELWRLRESISEAQKHEGGSIKHDVSVPVSKVAHFIMRGMELVSEAMPGVRPCPFGHIGDGNIHFNLTQPEGMDKAAFLDQWEPMNRIVHDLVIDLGGSISAEHGIGKLKRDELAHYAPDVEIRMMRAVKAALDPNNIMNPGKVVPE